MVAVSRERRHRIIPRRSHISINNQNIIDKRLYRRTNKPPFLKIQNVSRPSRPTCSHTPPLLLPTRSPVRPKPIRPIPSWAKNPPKTNSHPVLTPVKHTTFFSTSNQIRRRYSHPAPCCCRPHLSCPYFLFLSSVAVQFPALKELISFGFSRRQPWS